MNPFRRPLRLLAAIFLVLAAAGAARAEQAEYVPMEGQPGKDVVWVPTPHDMVETMLDIAKVTPQDYVIDLGSGDGRNLIAAAKRGARGHGVEYNPDLVEFSRRLAAKEGVADRVSFIQGDMFEADISKATVLPLFLLEDNLQRLTPKFLQLRPGTRIVLNSFPIPGWDPDETGSGKGQCSPWCTAYLYIVPAKVAGTWRLAEGELNLTQVFQRFTGTISSGARRQEIANGRLRGDEISFTVGKTRYSGRVNGNEIVGEMSGSVSGTWRATRQ